MLAKKAHELEQRVKELSSEPGGAAEAEAMRAEFQERLAAAERKVYALTKERDVLKREADRQGTASDALKEKEVLVEQVMAEGAKLSKTVSDLEAEKRRLKSALATAEADKESLESRLAAETAKCAALAEDKKRTEAELTKSSERTEAELGSQRARFESELARKEEELNRLRASSDEAQEAEKQTRFAEMLARERSMQEVVRELKEAGARRDSAAALREDALRRDLSEAEERCRMAEERHSQLAERLPEATRPLLRQIEAMQAESASRAEAWKVAEETMGRKLADAEASRALAEERMDIATAKLTEAKTHEASLAARLEESRREGAAVRHALEEARDEAAEARAKATAASEEAARDVEAATSRANQYTSAKEAMIEREAATLRSEVEMLRSQIERLKEEQSQQAASAAATLSAQNAASVAAAREAAAATVNGNSPSAGSTPRVWSGGGAKGSQESLEAQLREKDGEMAEYRRQVQALEKTRDSLAEELLASFSAGEKAGKVELEASHLRRELAMIQSKFYSALELMGERDEQVDELKADLEEARTSYREQVDRLTTELATAKSMAAAS